MNLEIIIITAIITGIVAAAGTTFSIAIALRVHVDYIKAHLARHDDEIREQKQRIDRLFAQALNRNGS